MTARPYEWDVSVQGLGFDPRRLKERCEVPRGARLGDRVVVTYDTNEILPQRFSATVTIAEARRLLADEGYDPGLTVDLDDLLEESAPAVVGDCETGWLIPPDGEEWDALIERLKSQQVIEWNDDMGAFRPYRDWDGDLPEDDEGYEP